CVRGSEGAGHRVTRARRRDEGLREGQDRAVQVPALDRLRHRAPEDRDGQDPALQAPRVMILAVNAGSSSLKYQLVDTTVAGERRITRGLIERVTSHDAAVTEILERLRKDAAPSPEAVGHRIVHGGPHFTAPTILDGAVISE